MNRTFYPPSSNTSSNPTTTTTRQPFLPQAPLPNSTNKSYIPEQRFHSRNTSDPQDYHRRTSIPAPPLPSVNHYDDDDTEDADEDEEMAAYTSRNGPPQTSTGSAGSRPGSSSKDSGSAAKKPKTKSTKVFQCTGYGDCTMQFTRSEHLARHIRKHTGERPFHCDCGRNFSRLDNLRQHMTTVHAQQYPPPSSNAPPARQPPQTKPSGTVTLSVPPHRSGFKHKHRPGPLTLPTQGYSNASPPGSPRYKAYSATAAQFPVTYHDPPPSPLATASGNFSGTNPSWHRSLPTLPALGPLSGGSSSSSAGGSSSSYFSGHLSPPATATFPPSPNTAYFGPPSSATYIHNHHPGAMQQQRHPQYDDKASRRQTWHEGLNGNSNNKLPSIRTIWNGEDEHHRPPYSPNNFNTSYLRSPVSSTDDPRNHYSPASRRASLPNQNRIPSDRKSAFERTPEEDDEDCPMRNGTDRPPGSISPSSSSDDAMDIDSKKITSIADLCHPDRGSRHDRHSLPTPMSNGPNSGMDLLSQAAAALIDR